MKGRLFRSPSDHYAGMNTVMHAVFFNGPVERSFDLILRHTDIEIKGLGAFEQAIDMLIEKSELAMI